MAQQRQEGLSFLAFYHCSIDSWAPSKLSKEGSSVGHLLCSSNLPGNASDTDLMSKSTVMPWRACEDEI